MTTFYNAYGMPQYTIKSHGNGMTSFYTPSGVRFGGTQKFGNSTALLNKHNMIIGYQNKSNVGTTFTNRFGTVLGRVTPFGGGLQRISNATGQTTGYRRKEPGGITLLDSNFKRLGVYR